MTKEKEELKEWANGTCYFFVSFLIIGFILIVTSGFGLPYYMDYKPIDVTIIGAVWSVIGCVIWIYIIARLDYYTYKI